MSRRTSALAWTGFVVTLLLLTVDTWLIAVNLGSGRLNAVASVDIEVTIFALGFIAVGTVVTLRLPKNPVGWIFWAGGVEGATQTLFSVYGASPGAPRAGVVAGWLADGLGKYLFIAGFTYIAFLFPNGSLPSQRWRAPAKVSVVLLVIAGATALATQPVPSGRSTALDGASSPVRALLSGWPLAVFTIGCASLPPLAALLSLASRFHRSSGDERQQLKWLLYASAVVVLAVVLLPLLDRVQPGYLPGLTDGLAGQLLFDASLLTILGIPVAAGVAILKHRLYDIDVVVNRTLVYGALAAFITGVYVAIVVGVGTLIGNTDRPNVALSITATAVVAVAFQQVRERIQRVANRLVYGQRASPYQVLSQFSEGLSAAYVGEEALPRMARVIAEGMRARQADVWLRVGDRLRRAASWPDPGALVDSPTVDGQLLPDIPSADLAVPVRHQEELLGALTVSKRRGESVSPLEESLLGDLAAQAGLVLKNVRLTAELQARRDELTASRQRLVVAQDEERRRLERNIRDGAEQHLAALRAQAAMAEELAHQTAGSSRIAISRLKGNADDALEALREIARGIYPPLLAHRGLAAALDAQARRAPLPVQIDADGLARYPEEVEAAVYFCCVEALRNAVRHAQARGARVRVAASSREVSFEVEDDGRGFDPAMTERGSGLQNMADRLDALGGRLNVESRPHEGTRLVGHLPVGSRLEPAAEASHPAVQSPAAGSAAMTSVTPV